MNTQNKRVARFRSACICLSLLAFSQVGFATDIRSITASELQLQPRPVQQSENLILGSEFSNGKRGRFSVVNNLKAVTSSSQNANNKQQSTSTSGKQSKTNTQSIVVPSRSTDVVETKGNFSIVRTAAASAQQSGAAALSTDATPLGAGELPVVRNAYTGVLGVVVGNINIKYKDGYDGHSIASDYGATLVGELASVRLAFLKRSNDMQDILSLYNSLLEDDRLEGVNIDILEYPSYPK